MEQVVSRDVAREKRDVSKYNSLGDKTRRDLQGSVRGEACQATFRASNGKTGTTLDDDACSTVLQILRTSEQPGLQGNITRLRKPAHGVMQPRIDPLSWAWLQGCRCYQVMLTAHRVPPIAKMKLADISECDKDLKGGYLVGLHCITL